jgi:hypothetical protein
MYIPRDAILKIEMRAWYDLVCTNGPTTRSETRNEPYTCRGPLPSSALEVLAEPELTNDEDIRLFNEMHAAGRLVRTDYEEWRKIELPPHMKGQGYMIVSDTVVTRTPYLVRQTMEEYEHKLRILLLKYNLAHYEIKRRYYGSDMQIAEAQTHEISIGRDGKVKPDNPYIGLNANYMQSISDRGAFEVLIHEIAHAIVQEYKPSFFGVGHDDLWKKVCIRIGGTGKQYYDPEANNEFVYRDYYY